MAGTSGRKPGERDPDVAAMGSLLAWFAQLEPIMPPEDRVAAIQRFQSEEARAESTRFWREGRRATR